MLVAQQPSTFLDFFHLNQMLQLFTFIFCFLLHYRKKHNGSLYDFDGIYEVHVAPLLRRFETLTALKHVIISFMTLTNESRPQSIASMGAFVISHTVESQSVCYNKYHITFCSFVVKQELISHR